jgi:hypothetical protein
MAQSVVMTKQAHFEKDNTYNLNRGQRQNKNSRKTKDRYHLSRRNQPSNHRQEFSGNYRKDKYKFKQKTNKTPNMNSGNYKRTHRSHSPTYQRQHRNFRDTRKSNWVPQEEWDRRRREGKCLKCGSGDHMTRQCLDTQTVLSSNKHPPGIRSKHVEVSNMDETEQLHVLADSTECANEIELAAIGDIWCINRTGFETSTYATYMDICKESSNNNIPKGSEQSLGKLATPCQIILDSDEDLPGLLSISNSSTDNLPDYDQLRDFKPNNNFNQEENSPDKLDDVGSHDCEYKNALLRLLSEVAAGSKYQYSKRENYQRQRDYLR